MGVTNSTLVGTVAHAVNAMCLLRTRSTASSETGDSECTVQVDVESASQIKPRTVEARLLKQLPPGPGGGISFDDCSTAYC